MPGCGNPRHSDILKPTPAPAFFYLTRCVRNQRQAKFPRHLCGKGFRLLLPPEAAENRVDFPATGQLQADIVHKALFRPAATVAVDMNPSNVSLGTALRPQRQARQIHTSVSSFLQIQRQSAAAQPGCRSPAGQSDHASRRNQIPSHARMSRRGPSLKERGKHGVRQ